MNELQELESLLQELLSGVQAVMQSGEILTDEILGGLSQTLGLLSNRIDELRTPLRPPVPPEKISLSRPMPSSNIHSFGYDPKNERLLVKFQGDYPDQNGPVYGYDKVPKVIFDMFQKGAIPARTNGQNKWGQWWKGKVPSLGASLYTLIKQGGYGYQRLT